MEMEPEMEIHIVTILDILMRIAFPLIIAWNTYLFSLCNRNKDALHRFQLHVAENFTSKSDLQKMIDDMEVRLEKQLSTFLKTIHNRPE